MKNENQNIYEQHGFKNREEYLRSFVDDKISEVFVFRLAEINGPGKDFTDLPKSIEWVRNAPDDFTF